jgi:glycosyltransferase involved in cell wall biosynthesis
MKKILQINVINELSSTGRTTSELGEYLKKNNFESRIAVSIGEKSNEVYIIGNKLDHKIHAVLSRLFGLQGYFSYFATRKLLSYINRENPDVVHLRNLHGNFIHVPLLFKYLKKKQIPTVITLHDCWLYTGKCCHYTMIKCERWRNSCGKCPKLKDDNVSLFFDQTSKMLKNKIKYINELPYLAVIGVSEWITKEAECSKVFENTKYIKKIYNWIDLNRFYPRETTALRNKLNLQDDLVLLSVASGWSEKKGLDKIIRLAKELPEDVTILLVGSYSNTVGTLPENVKLVGLVNNPEELSYYYSLADVYLNMSLEESFGKVSAEALACGTPVIAMNSTANAEIIGEDCGFILREFDEQEILKCIQSVKEKTKDFYRKACVEWAKEQFSYEKNAAEYIDVYNTLMKMKEIEC